MRILFNTQSESLALFDALRAKLGRHMSIERSGFTLADSWAYRKWLADHPDFEQQGHSLLKEWEVTAHRQGKPDLAKLALYEREIGGEPGLFGAIVADRRLFMGKDCTYSQDYRRRFSDDELLCILQRGLEETERLFDELKPDVVISFICVTMLDYLTYLFARARGIRVLNLRPTRIGDRVAFSSILNDPAPEFVNAYERICREGTSPCMEEARQYIRRVREKHGRYEGVVRPSDKPALRVNAARRPPWESAWRVARNYLDYRGSLAARDNHVADPLRALFFATVMNPMRARLAARYLGQRYITQEDLKGIRYAFYPLHTEPEVSLLVYGRPFVNQIEIIRSIAMSLPVDMVLVVKEHPWMVGKRTLGAYRKILNIPRARIASPALEARQLIAGSDLVAVITGSVSLEAAMLNKPVITFGDCPYNALPPFMVRRCDDPRRLQSIIRDLLTEYRVDESALEAYVTAVMETSEGVHLYSTLLAKKGVHVERAGDFEHEISKLTDYATRILSSPPQTTSSGAAAAW